VNEAAMAVFTRGRGGGGYLNPLLLQLPIIHRLLPDFPAMHVSPWRLAVLC